MNKKRILSLFVVLSILAGLIALPANAGNRIGSRRALLRVGEEIRYLLRATFSVGNVALNAGDIETQAPGSVEDGTLTAVETDGTLAIVSNKLAFTAQGTPTWGDLGFYSQAITRALGTGLLGTVNLDDGGSGVAFSWQTTASTFNGVAEEYAFRLVTAATDEVRAHEPLEASGRNVAAIAPSTDYQLAIVLGGADSNGVPWRSGEIAANYLYGAAFYIKGGGFTTWTKLWKATPGNTATLYAALSTYDEAGTIDDFRVPDADLSAVLQPNNLSTMGSAGELDAYVPDVGGGWSENIGDWDTSGGTLQATTLGIGTFTGLADSVYDAKITMPGAGVTAGGLVLRGSDYTGASEDYWYIKVVPATVGNDFSIVEYAAGAVTTRAQTDVDFSAATAYAIRAINDTQTIDAFADGGDKISYSSASSGQTSTDFGLRDEGNSNMTFDNVVLFNRTGNLYNILDDN